MTRRSIYYFTFLLIVLGSVTCKKQDEFLAEKPTAALAEITSLSDIQKLLNNESLFNDGNVPDLPEVSSDEYYVTYAGWIERVYTEQAAYLWEKKVYSAGENVRDWYNPYTQIYYANTILDRLPDIKIDAGEKQMVDRLKGTALFFRAFAYFNLLQVFAAPYDSTTAQRDLGVPLRLISDFNVRVGRNTQEECYNQIFQDLSDAYQLLPERPIQLTQPGKLTVNALLARIYNCLGKYEMALSFANKTLEKNGILVDYNQLTNTDYFFITSPDRFLQEDIFHCTMHFYGMYSFSTGIVDSTLYSMFEDNDLRKGLFFMNYADGLRFKGSYEYVNFGYCFSGLATDEIYLIRAESYARRGDIQNAMKDMNTLLVKRYKAGTFVPLNASSVDDALRKVLNERRKELCYRGLRWLDLRRLNKDTRFAVTLKRVLNGVNYVLPPNDVRYTFPIPDRELALNNIPQNPR
ncbi:RagB/SusD family nutrient uptake outer membrane protein [Chitinophaga vietnamensis]|uniref:RagB/SusD family nutrient uptake outer membrane protein n=1 Tax=Chitinophaga vietnamensis TaxID=2593957 RepID=UPI00117822FB|nr:RagB/SusD family nutrient uptake outer membrane protein [Chitinophaga vietnamensis]